MKISAYNIMSGGFNSYSSAQTKPERLELLRQAIKEINADFIGLIDTFRWKDVFTSADLEKIFGYQKTFHIDMEDVRVEKEIGITVLTNNLDVVFSKLWLETRYCIKVEYQKNGELVDIYVVYFDDISEAVRLKQLKALLDKIDKNRKTIIMGDFNAIYPEDGAEIKKTMSLFLEKKLIPENNKEYFFKYGKEISKAEVVRNLFSEGFQDARKENEREFTFATELFPLKLGQFICVDHIFYRGNLNFENFKVMRGDVFEKASDHCPIVVEME